MNPKNERRLYPRYEKQFKAQYITSESTRGSEECTVINASLKGMGVIFHTRDTITVGSTIILEIPVRGKSSPYSIKGKIKWVKKRETDSIGGIVLDQLFDALPREENNDGRQDGGEENRVHIRFDTDLKGRYFIKELGQRWGNCTVFDVSRTGMGIKFHTPETIDVGSTITVEIEVPSELEPMSVKGILRWIKPADNEFLGGIELTEVLDEIKSLIIMLRG
jgi:Tfp pilus assembly protein PilZ